MPSRLMHLLLTPDSDYSIHSLLCALVVASLFYARRRRQAGRRVQAAALARALFPRRLLTSRSARADVSYFLLNTLFLASLLGWAILSSVVVANVVNGHLVSIWGPQSPSALPPWAIAALATVLLFLAFEFAYWLEHYMSHAVPVLWEFHKVHHSAEVLTPLTNARIHPVNALIFLNMVAVCVGTTRGLLDFSFGMAVSPLTIVHTNALFVAFTFLTTHLQHSHVWIAFTGWTGRVVLSPAHHQIHHSTDPRHFNKNFGSSLAVFDWLFGTLYVPSKYREALNFGVDDLKSDHNTLVGGIAGPFLAVAAMAMRTVRRSRPVRPMAAE